MLLDGSMLAVALCKHVKHGLPSWLSFCESIDPEFAKTTPAHWLFCDRGCVRVETGQFAVAKGGTN
jgi:hypothetical protein